MIKIVYNIVQNVESIMYLVLLCTAFDIYCSFYCTELMMYLVLLCTVHDKNCSWYCTKCRVSDVFSIIVYCSIFIL